MKVDKDQFCVTDIRWEVFSNTTTIEEFNFFYLFTDTLELSVDKDIRDYEEIIQKLLVYSYYEYEFITVAVRYSFLMFELALHRYYLKLTGRKFNGILANLITKYEEGKFITPENSSVLELIRNLRNHFTHPTMYNILPPSSIEIVKLNIYVINQLNQIYQATSK